MKRNSILTVNLDTISNNVSVLQNYLQPGVKQMAVVKANAYGHGAVQVARHIAPQVDWFAVNDIDEGIELRKNAIQHPVLVFSVPETSTVGLYQKFNLTATVSADAHFGLLPRGTRYHLNFDTGMGRLGFYPEEVDNVRRLQTSHPELYCTGIYSHFATADELNTSKAEEQYQRFKEIRRHFEPELLTHFCNTAGLVQYREAQFDMVRTGIGIYGYAPGYVSISELEPAMAWQTRIVQQKSVKKGASVSYGATWRAKKDGFIAIIPVGYSDGIPRGLSGNFEVTIGEKIYPVAGTVTMNYCMIDLGPKQAGPGASVALWNKNHSAKDWAKKMNTIPYEMVTNLSREVRRKFIKK